jgi:hypothetical protein
MFSLAKASYARASEDMQSVVDLSWWVSLNACFAYIYSSGLLIKRSGSTSEWLHVHFEELEVHQLGEWSFCRRRHLLIRAAEGEMKK